MLSDNLEKTQKQLAEVLQVMVSTPGGDKEIVDRATNKPVDQVDLICKVWKPRQFLGYV